MRICLQYVREDVDRHGNVRIYVVQPGQRKVRIRELPGTDAFMTAYLAAMGGAKPASGPRRAAENGSFSRLCMSYYASIEFRRLDAATQDWRRRYLDRICATDGDMPATALTPKKIRGLRNSLANKPVVANATLDALKALFRWAVEADQAGIDTNPTLGVERIAYHSEGYHTWTAEEIAQYEATHPVGTNARLAMALLLHTAGRREDAVRLGPQHARNGRIRFTQAKNEHRKPVVVDLPLSHELGSIIAATQTGHLVFLITKYGKPFTTKGFGTAMRIWCDAAGLQKCSAHGLRKAAATRLAESGATVEEIMAVTGHRSLRQIEVYTRAANRALMADNAFVKLRRE